VVGWKHTEVFLCTRLLFWLSLCCASVPPFLIPHHHRRRLILRGWGRPSPYLQSLTPHCERKTLRGINCGEARGIAVANGTSSAVFVRFVGERPAHLGRKPMLRKLGSYIRAAADSLRQPVVSFPRHSQECRDGRQIPSGAYSQATCSGGHGKPLRPIGEQKVSSSPTKHVSDWPCRPLPYRILLLDLEMHGRGCDSLSGREGL